MTAKEMMDTPPVHMDGWTLRPIQGNFPLTRYWIVEEEETGWTIGFPGDDRGKFLARTVLDFIVRNPTALDLFPERRIAN